MLVALPSFLQRDLRGGGAKLPRSCKASRRKRGLGVPHAAAFLPRRLHISCSEAWDAQIHPGSVQKVSSPCNPAPAGPAGLQRPASRLSGTELSFGFQPQRGPPAVPHREPQPTRHFAACASLHGGTYLSPRPSARCPRLAFVPSVNVPRCPESPQPNPGASSPLSGAH